MLSPFLTMIRTVRASSITPLIDQCSCLRTIVTKDDASEAIQSMGDVSSSRDTSRDGSLITKKASASRSGFTETVHADYQPNILTGVKVNLSSKESTRRLSKADTWVVDNLVGCLTKEGKKATAQKIVLEAMDIIRTELAQSAAISAAETAAKIAKATEVSEKAATSVSGRRSRKETLGVASR